MFADWRFSVALRLFGTASSHRLMSFVGLLSVSGLTLAVAVLVTVLSVVNGFERELSQRVLAVLPHGTLYARQGFSEDSWRAQREFVLRHTGVVGAAPIVEGSALIVGKSGLQGISFNGVDPALEPTVSILPRFMQGGAGFESLDKKRYGALVGVELAEQAGLVIGDKLTVILPTVSFSIAGPVLTTKRLEIVGTFKVGADIDKSHIFVHINDALRLKRQQAADGLVVRTTDLFSAPGIIHQIVTTSPNQSLYGSSWMQRQGNLYEAIRTQKATMFLLLMILVAVASFNVVSNLVMTVDENRAEIAILRTMGASPNDLRVVFIIHGLLVGFVGVLLGVVLGLLLTSSLSYLFVAVNDLFQLELMREYFIRYLPTEVQSLDIFVIVMGCMVICLLATIYPASRAANANPVEALQYEL